MATFGSKEEGQNPGRNGLRHLLMLSLLPSPGIEYDVSVVGAAAAWEEVQQQLNLHCTKTYAYFVKTKVRVGSVW